MDSKVLNAKLIWYATWLGTYFVYVSSADTARFVMLLLKRSLRVYRMQHVYQICCCVATFYVAALVSFAHAHALSAYIPFMFLLPIMCDPLIIPSQCDVNTEDVCCKLDTRISSSYGF